jgi:hypothetical protein
MRAWPVLKSFGYLWLILEIVYVQFSIVMAFIEHYAAGRPPPEMDLRYVVWMVVVAAPGVASLIVAEALKAKRNATA